MSLVPSIAGLFKWRQFEPEVILLAIGWYLRFSLSYRDVEELLAERGIGVDHVTLWRWVQRYAPELEKRLRKRLKAEVLQLFGGRSVKVPGCRSSARFPACSSGANLNPNSSYWPWAGTCAFPYRTATSRNSWP